MEHEGLWRLNTPLTSEIIWDTRRRGSSDRRSAGGLMISSAVTILRFFPFFFSRGIYLFQWEYERKNLNCAFSSWRVFFFFWDCGECTEQKTWCSVRMFTRMRETPKPEIKLEIRIRPDIRRTRSVTQETCKLRVEQRIRSNKSERWSEFPHSNSKCHICH